MTKLKFKTNIRVSLPTNLNRLLADLLLTIRNRLLPQENGPNNLENYNLFILIDDI